MPRKKHVPLSSASEGYTFADVLVLTGASRNQLKFWTDADVIKASIEDTLGTGHHRRFSPYDVIEVELALAISNVTSKVTISADTIRGALGAFRSFHRGAVAVHGESTEAPLPHGWTRVQRERAARAFVVWQAPRALRSQADADAAVKHAQALAREWADLRAGDLRPRSSFVALVIGYFHGPDPEHQEASAAQIVMESERLSEWLSETDAIVINVVNAVDRVFERARSLGATFGEW